MKFIELICYLLNYKGKEFFKKQKHYHLNKISNGCVNFYKTEFWKDDDESSTFYIEKSGSFLNRLKNAINFFNCYFEKEDFTNKIVLEIGTGRGTNILFLSKYSKAKFIYGVEISPRAANFSRKMLKDHKITNAEIICRDMASVPEIKDNSVDLIISIAAFEHIMDLKAVLEESFRILKSGGIVYSSFSPIWRHYYGSHLGKEIPFPWTHLIFSEPTVRKTLERLQGKSQKSLLYEGLNKLTLADYKRIIKSTSFKSYKIYQTSSHPIKKIIKNIPIFNEYFAGSINIVLEK